MILTYFGNPKLLLILVSLVGALWKLSEHPAGKRFFQLTPMPFWCYFLPMIGTTLGWLPSSDPLYPFLSQQLLPVCLGLLLIGSDLRGLARLGWLSIGLMLAGAAGTLAGGFISFQLYKGWLPPESWGGIGALSASWIGGSANFLAVKEALGVPDSLVGPFVIVDALVAYSWMAFLIWASCFQGRWDRWISRSAPAAALQKQTTGNAGRPAWGPSARCGSSPAGHSRITPATGFVTGIALSILLSIAAQFISRRLPTFGHLILPATWTVLLITTSALLLSLTALRRLGESGLSKIGTFALYVLLASIGARANLKAITEAPVFLALGITWIAIHGLCLLAAGILLKAPLGLIATASQANIGGPISAPVVGATYSSGLAGIGLLMAILGNVMGTYLGLATAFLLRP